MDAKRQQDSIDRMIESWSPELPDIDLEVEAIVQRIQKLHRAIRRRMEETLVDFDLSFGEWAVLGQLRRSGAPYRSSPGQLAAHANLSSGAMTNRLDRLEQGGYIRRLPDPDDRRGVVVELTPAGADLWLRTVDAQAQKEAILASALTEREKRQLNKLLRRAVLGFERLNVPDG